MTKLITRLKPADKVTHLLKRLGSICIRLSNSADTEIFQKTMERAQLQCNFKRYDILWGFTGGIKWSLP